MALKIILSLIFLFFPQTVLATETCPPGEIRYREGGNCEKTTPNVHKVIPEYPVTCQDTPSVSYHRESETPPPNFDKAIVKVDSDISKAELGGFGPSIEAIKSKTPDALAAIYPFNALLDKPPNTSPYNERESFRTYWRLLSSLQQANAKAAYLTEANKGNINNQTFKFYNSKDQEKTWKLKELYNKLPDCLRKYPVCKDYVNKYQNLRIFFPNAQEAYDALMPFNFDNLRGYEVIKYKSPNGSTVTHIMAENLPYVAAINQGLLNPQTGILNTLSPSWVIPVRQSKFTSDITISSAAEGSLVNNIKNYAQIARCQNPTQGIYLPAPPTFPDGLDNSTNTLEQTFEIDITTRVEIRHSSGASPSAYKVYISEGGGTGTSSVQILNNPKQKDISLGIAEDESTSLFSMLTTAFSQSTYQDKDIFAPISKRTGEPVDPADASVGVAKPETIIPRKGGEPHVKLCELRNKWLIPASLQRNIDCENLSQSLSNLNPNVTPPPAPSSGSASCTAPEPFSSEFNELLSTTKDKFPDGAIHNVSTEVLRAMYVMEGFTFYTGHDQGCIENSSGAVGLMGITGSAYNWAAPPSQQVNYGGGNCGELPGKLNRCNPTDVFEIAARVLLTKVGLWDTDNFKPVGTLIGPNSQYNYYATWTYYGKFEPDTLTINQAINAVNLGYIAESDLRGGSVNNMGYADIVCAMMRQCPPYPTNPYPY
jgi:hypothetical protein